MTRSLASALFSLVFSSCLFAQNQGQDNCDLMVRVRTSNERSIDAPVQVEVLSPLGLIATAHVSGGDSAQFQVMSGKTYRLAVSGIGIQAVTTPYFEINPLEGTHTETVYVKPVDQKSAEQSAPGSPTISVSEMNVPKKAAAKMNKGLDAYAKGDTQKAEAYFEQAIAEYPHYARAYEMLGVIAVKSSNRLKARELFSKAIETDGSFVPAYVDLARMDLQDQDYAGSESLLAKAIAVNPSMPEAIALLASTEFANKEYDKALVDVQRTHALRNHERFAEVHIMAAKVLVMENHPDAAMAQFQLFLREKPDSPQAEDVRKALTSLAAEQRP